MENNVARHLWFMFDFARIRTILLMVWTYGIWPKWWSINVNAFFSLFTHTALLFPIPASILSHHRKCMHAHTTFFAYRVNVRAFTKDACWACCLHEWISNHCAEQQLKSTLCMLPIPFLCCEKYFRRTLCSHINVIICIKYIYISI